MWLQVASAARSVPQQQQQQQLSWLSLLFPGLTDRGLYFTIFPFSLSIFHLAFSI